jgi:DNA-binding NarL/FixJ family response regulator
MGRSDVIGVLLVDDQELLRSGFRLILETTDDIRVVGEAADGAGAVEAARRLRPDVVLMDIRMDGMDGIEATRRVIAAGVARVVVLTTFDLDEYVYAALRAGASGFLLKDTRPTDLVDAVRIVARGDALLAPGVTRRLLERFAQDFGPARSGTALEEAVADLTEREREVLRLLAGGRSNLEIADVLILSEGTIKTHVSNVLRKLGLRDRVQAVTWAYEHGLVRPGEEPPQS